MMGGETFTLSLCEPIDAERVGGKATGLARLQLARVPMPPGFAVTTEAFRQFLHDTGLQSRVARLEQHLHTDDFDQSELQEMRAIASQATVSRVLLDEIAQQCRAWEMQWRSAPLIVRSSATVEDSETHSYAGIFDSIPIEAFSSLPGALAEVWSSVFSDRAVAYYRLCGLSRFPEMAIVIQPFVEADRSGVMFTRFPGADGAHRVLIEHVAGACEKLVSGAVNPDRLWIDRWPQHDDRSLTERAVQPLTVGSTQTLCALARQLEEAWGLPLDIEWCLRDGRLYVLQARPITGLPNVSASTDLISGALLRGIGASPGQAAGSAHIVFNIDDADAIEPGQVLVTTMTNPDMVPAMCNSCAVVTEVGGMICHAAIVSRELGIPCVVGTETATSIAHERDPLTVNGDAGVVLAGIRTAESPSLEHPPLTWRALWDEWMRLCDDEWIPVLFSLDALEQCPRKGLDRCILAPFLDLVLDANVRAVMLEQHSAEGQLPRFARYMARTSGIAERLAVSRVLILPIYLEPYVSLLSAAAARFPRLSVSTRWRRDPVRPEIVHCVVADNSEYTINLTPTAETLRRPQMAIGLPLTAAGAVPAPAHELKRGIAASDADASAGVFGRQPAMRTSAMPDPGRRARYRNLVPGLDQAYATSTSAEPGREHQWLDLRPEVPITPILKSLVLPGIESIPAAMGFDDLEPLYVKWMRCRFHFRKDSFGALWLRLTEATWDERFLADLLDQTRDSYHQLQVAAEGFPRTDEQWREAHAADLQDLFISWWHSFVRFFSLSFFIQALGDDCLFPLIAETVQRNSEYRKAAAADDGFSWPGVPQLTAPVTPVLTAEYLADLQRLKRALAQAKCRTTEEALRVLEHNDNPELSRVLEEHRQHWYWMRERDPYYEPYDQLEAILGKALAVREADPPDYAENRRRLKLALSVHFEQAHRTADPARFAYAVRYGHELSLERENHHVVWLKASYPFRKLCVEWERRLRETTTLQAGDIFFMEAPEAMDCVQSLPDPVPAALQEAVQNRRIAYHHVLRLTKGETETTEPKEEDDYY